MDAQNIHVGRVAPVVFADLPAHRVVELSRMSNHVALIYNGEGTAVPTLGTSVPTIRADTVQGRGIDGSPLEVAIIEAPDDGASRVDDDLSCLAVSGVCGAGSGESSHATRVAGVVASTMSGLTGVAPGANIVSGASGDTYEQLEDLLYCTYMDSGDVFNMSLAVYYVKGCSPVPAADFIVDCFVRNYARAVIVAAGNYSLCGNHRITSPGRGWNVITVGASYDSGTSGWTDDSMWSGSCFRDPLSTHGDREKPEVVAPGQSITSLDIGSGCSATSTGTGTSLAAPHVSGTIALMLDRDHDKHCLKWWPEASKAILMASAFNNITGSTDLSDKDGAGGIDAASADLVVQGAANHGGWTARNLEADDFGSDGWLTLSSFTLTTDADRLRIALTWDAGCIPDFGSSYFEWLDADLDLFVYRGSTLVGASGSYDNNYELLEVRGANAGTYTVKVAKYRFGNPTKLGFAWAAKH
jgi:subtilisin family serine protease